MSRHLNNLIVGLFVLSIGLAVILGAIYTPWWCLLLVVAAFLFPLIDA